MWQHAPPPSPHQSSLGIMLYPRRGSGGSRNVAEVRDQRSGLRTGMR
jgi:hypothetical protein